MREYSNNETCIEFAGELPLCACNSTCFRGFAHAEGVLRPAALQYSFARHLQIRQRKHHQELAGVLSQTSIAYFAVVELALDHAKPVLSLGANACLEFLELLVHRVDRAAVVHE